MRKRTFLDLLATAPPDIRERAGDWLDDQFLVQDEDEPFEPGMRFMLWLTRQEWQFVYCLGIALQMAGEMSTRILIHEAFRAVLFKVEYDTGHEWKGVTTKEGDADLVLVAKLPRAVEPRNAFWISQLHDSDKHGVPDYEAHFPQAIRFAEQHRALSRYVKPLEDCWSQMQADLLMALRKPLDDGEKDILDEMRDAVQGAVN